MITKTTQIGKKTLIICFTFLVLVFSISLCIKLTSSLYKASSSLYADFDSTSNTFVIGTSKVKRTIQITPQGSYVTKSLIDLENQTEYVNTSVSEVSIVVNQNLLNGKNSIWSYISHNTNTLKQGELELVLNTSNGIVNVSKHYIIYPETSIIQEYTDITNITGSTAIISFPSLYNYEFDITGSNNSFYYMTGNGNYTGSGMLKEIDLNSNYSRLFDSIDNPEVVPLDGYAANGIANNFMGVGIYNEFFAYRDNTKKQGIFITFDYIGRWNANVNYSAHHLSLDSKVYMNNYQSPNNQVLTTPYSMMGFYKGDIDDMGNTILEYNYMYKWDYTNVENVGFLKVPQWITGYQTDNAFNISEILRYTGANVLHIDDDWFETSGVWENHPFDDFFEINELAKKSGNYMTVWIPIWMVWFKDQVALEHPDWIIPGEEGERGGNASGQSSVGYGTHLNTALEEVYQFMIDKLNYFQDTWGSFMWRYDAEAAAVSKINGISNYNDMLFQNNNYFRLLKEFKETNPEAMVYGCSSGGHALTIESSRYSDTQQISDGGIGYINGRYISLLVPPDKLTSGNTGVSYVWGNTFSRWQHANLFMASEITGFIADAQISAEDKEEVRLSLEMYRFLQKENTVGKWVKVYRPTVSAGIDEERFNQKMDKDNNKGYISISNYDQKVGSTFKVYPKGLKDSSYYTISSWYNSTPAQTKTGLEWKNSGVTISSMQVGEMLFINLENRPGNGCDNVNPTAPSNLTVQSSTYLNRTGVELNFNSGSDENFLSYYQIYRNGKKVDKLSTGTFYFGLNGNIYDTWGVSSVDGDGNESEIIYITSVVQNNPNVYNYTTDFNIDGVSRGWSYYESRYGNKTPLVWNEVMKCYENSISDASMSIDRFRLGNSDLVFEWTSKKAGIINIVGEISKVKSKIEGDGVVLSIYHNSNIIFGPFLIRSDNILGITHNLTEEVGIGDVISFKLEKNYNNIKDNVNYSPTIYYDTVFDDVHIESLEFADKGLEVVITKDKSISLPVRIYPLETKETLVRYEIIDGNILASIDNAGLLTPIDSGLVTVKVISIYNESIYDVIDVLIYDNMNMFVSNYDFNGIQGYRNWEYGYFSNTAYTNYGLMSYDFETFTWRGNNQYNIIQYNIMHPAVGGYPSKTFIAPYSGNIKITGNVRKDSTGVGGDGIFYTIKHNNSFIINNGIIEGWDTIGKNFSYNVSVNKGDKIYFIIGSRNENGYDGTNFSPTIEYITSLKDSVFVNNIDLRLSNNQTSVMVGSSVNIYADVYPNNATNKELRWSINKITGEAYFDELNKRIIPILPGFIEVYVMSKDAATILRSMVIEIKGKNSVFVANSVIDYSILQGFNNWSYYYAAKGTNNYILMNLISQNANNITYAGNGWSRMFNNGMHPDASYDAIRAYTANFSGTIRLVGTVYKDPSGLGGDGVVAQVKLNNETVWNATISGSDNIGKYYDISIDVVIGDKIYFVLGSNINEYMDSTIWITNIEYTSVTDSGYSSSNAVDNAILSLPNVDILTYEDVNQVLEVYNMYLELSQDDKKYVFYYLELDNLVVKASSILLSYNKGKEISDLIAIIPPINNIKLTDEYLINNILDAYNNLTIEQKAYVTNYLVLENAINQINVLKDVKKASSVSNLIMLLPYKEDLELSDSGMVNLVTQMYENLSAAQKEYISATDYNKLIALQNQILLLEKIETVKPIINSIHNLPTNITVSNEDTLNNILSKYNLLDSEHKALVTNYSKLEDSFNKLELYKLDIVVINNINKLINDLPSNISVKDKDKVNEIKGLVQNLTPSQQNLKYLLNTAKLNAAIKALGNTSNNSSNNTIKVVMYVVIFIAAAAVVTFIIYYFKKIKKLGNK
ncbi:MAG: hypothetical protein LBV51_04450 [Acholeplasmatales bacterium]|jgi:hypothetical protein|nr:hypothetical protein [Acholeplasmatales bacterium]